MAKARAKRWTKSKIRNGIGTIQLHSWKYFLDFMYQEMMSYESYIWRGQRCDDWQLESTLDRLIRDARVAKTKRPNFAQQHLDRFKYATRGRRGTNPPGLKSDNDWWALGQHHGLSTPLLDWTSAPFVAAYFAFIEEGEPQTPRRVVYALHQPAVEATAEVVHLEREKAENKRVAREIKRNPLAAPLLKPKRFRRPVEFIRPRSNDNARLVSQAGLFTRAPLGESLDEWIDRNWDGDEGYTLMRITIPNGDRTDCLRSLNRMNINHLTLFPDLHGASKFSNLHASIKQY